MLHSLTMFFFMLAGLPGGYQNPAAAPAPELRSPDVRYEPSTPAQSKAMLKLAKVGKKDLVYDLGCGDGRLPIMAVKEFGARGAVGIDIDPQRIRESVANAQTAGVLSKVTFRNEDLFTANIHDATVVTLFLYDWINLKLRPKLLSELRPGTRIVSHYHDMGEWKPEKTIEVGGHKIYLWTVPLETPEFKN
jgi:trans-aconitate methyltransferase